MRGLMQGFVRSLLARRSPVTLPLLALQGLLHVEDDGEEEFEIDINEQEPAFL